MDVYCALRHRYFLFRLFGPTGHCSACSKMIPAFEMVMRAKDNVYHLECFACQQCNHRYRRLGYLLILHKALNLVYYFFFYSSYVTFSLLFNNNCYTGFCRNQIIVTFVLPVSLFAISVVSFTDCSEFYAVASCSILLVFDCRYMLINQHGTYCYPYFKQSGKSLTSQLTSSSCKPHFNCNDRTLVIRFCL